jgi:hypothetical protein
MEYTVYKGYSYDFYRSLELKRRSNFSTGGKCECMCHTKGNIQDFCGYCASSHTKRTATIGMKR